MPLSVKADVAVGGEEAARGRRAGVRPAIVLYTVTSLVASGLLFSVEPMVAKLLLPAYGGSPMLWNTAVLFFQGALLAGYAYAHWSQRLLGRRLQPLVHLVLVAAPLAVLPLALPGWASPPESAPTALWLLLVLAVLVGAPFAVLATTGPLVQRWYSWSGLPRSDDPYFLYAAGNAGSLAALLAYPFLVEPSADLTAQARWWSSGYVAFVVLTVLCAVVVRVRRPAAESPAAGPDEPITWRRRGRWLGLAFLPSSLMLGVTTHMSTDIAPVPLMWVVPLALYLVTFIVAFGVRSWGWLPVMVTAAAAGAAMLPVLFVLLAGALPAYVLVLDLFVLAAGGLACHGLLARDRPEPARLTEFFLLVSLGGVLGGLFNGLLAPMLFDWGAELPLVVGALVLLLWAAPRDKARGLGRVGKAALLAGPTLTLVLWTLAGGTWGILLGGVLAVASCVLLTRTRGPFALLVAVAMVLLIGVQYRDSPHRERTFFGAYKIVDRGAVREFAHGTTVHGTQFRDPARRRIPTAYYARGGPLGDVFAAYGTAGRVAAVGLGAGTVASYGRAGQRFDFYEIDPAVVRIARERFTYLRDCPCETRTVVGDGRLRLAGTPDGSYGLIVLDAFSSDAVPAHLLTREALRLYMRKLRPGGALAFHVSNRHLDLEPMLGATARAEGLAAVARHGGDHDRRGDKDGALLSHWVVLARVGDDLRPLRSRPGRWRDVAPTGPVWTDAHSSLWGVLRITRP